MTAVNHPADRRGSTVSLPAPDNPLPPAAACSFLLSLRAFSSFSKSDRSILTESWSNFTTAADGVTEPQPEVARAAASPAARAATAVQRRNGLTALNLVPGRRGPGRGAGAGGGGGGHRGRLLAHRDQLGQHRQQALDHLQPVLLGADRA